MKTTNLTGFIVLCFLFVQQQIKTQDTISVNFLQTYQTIEGFGGKYIYDQENFLIDDMGMSLGRIILNSGFKTSETAAYNLNDGLNFEGGIDMSAANINQFKSKGMTNYFVTPFSAPPYMKYINTDYGTDAQWNRLSNGLGPQSNLVDGLTGVADAKRNFYPDYSDYLVEFCKMFKQTFGFEVKYISMQNEPRFPEPYSSTVYDPKQMRDLIRLVGPKLDAAGLKTKIMVPEDMGSFSVNTPWFETLLKDSVCRKYIGVWAVHSYTDGIAPDLGSASGWSNLYSEVQKYGLSLWMTETSGYSPNTNWAGAGFELAQSIYLALKFGKISAWAYNMLVDPGWGGSQGALIDKNKVPQKNYYASKQFYKYINPGAFQVESNSSSKKLLVTTFKNPISKLFTMVVINLDAASSHTAKFIIPGLSTTMHLYRSSESENFADQGNVNINSVSFPANSVSTLIYQGTNASPVIDPINNTAVVMNTTSNKLRLTGIGDGDSGIQSIAVSATSADNTLMANPVVTKINDSSYDIDLLPKTNKTGQVNITVAVQDNGSSDLFNTTYKTFNVKIIPFINIAPNVNPINDLICGMNNKTKKQSVYFTGINDGNDGSQTITKPTITLSNPSILRLPYINYTTNATNGNLEFYPNAIGSTTVTLTFQDNGGTDIGGHDTKTVSFKITVVEEYQNKVPDNFSENHLIAYPNPASDVINIKLPDISYTSLVVYNITGNMVFQKNVTSLDETINTKDFNSGIYFIEAISIKGIKNTKIIVNK